MRVETLEFLRVEVVVGQAEGARHTARRGREERLRRGWIAGNIRESTPRQTGGKTEGKTEDLTWDSIVVPRLVK